MSTQIERLDTKDISKSRHRWASVLLHASTGVITASLSFAAPAHATPTAEHCAANATVLVATLKQTAFWQILVLRKKAPELTEGEFVEICQDLHASAPLIQVLERQFISASTQKQPEIVPLDAIPERVRSAFVAAEDADFYHREKMGFAECAKRAASSLDASITQLAQRIPGAQQYGPSSSGNFSCYSEFSRWLARILLLARKDRYSIKRKFKEILIADHIEAVLDKPMIFQLYLNQIYLGRNTWGVAAAAQRYFGKELSELAVEEAAYLAALAKAPNHYATARNHQKALERRNWVIRQMAKGGYISPAEAQAAVMRPLIVNTSNR